MRNNKIYLLMIIILLLVIGFASIATTLVINGNINIGSGTDDFDVIFTSATLDNSTDNVVISDDSKKITFVTKTLTLVNEETELDYTIKNTSTQYGAKVTINCTYPSTNYLSISNNLDGTDITNIASDEYIYFNANEEKAGTINIELVKAYVGDDLSYTFTCELVATAVELTSDDIYVAETDNLEWLKYNDMVVTSANIDYYDDTYSGITEGTVFLNYTTDTSEVYNAKDLSLSTAQYGLTLLSASESDSLSATSLVASYNENEDYSYLDIAKLIGNNTINNKVFEKKYAATDDILTFSVPNTKMVNSTWGYDDSYYSYALDSLMMAKFLIELTNYTGETKYAETGLKIIDSWIFIQDVVGTGALPQYVYYADLSWGSGMWMTWSIYPLDISYSVYLAGTAASKYTNESKYQTFIDDYFEFVYDSLENNSGYFEFTQDGNTYKLPYEYMYKTDDSIYGINQSNQDYTNSTSNDITTDQLFYTLLGLVSYNKNYELISDFTESLSAICINNVKFWGEYQIDGNKGSFEETTIEILNSAFYKRYLNLIGDTSNDDAIKNYLASIVNKSSTSKTINGSWTWDDADGKFVIETLATSVIIQELYTNGMMY